MSENQKSYTTIEELLARRSEDVDAPSGARYKIRGLAAIDFMSLGKDFPLGTFFEEERNPGDLKKALEALPLAEQLDFAASVLVLGVTSINVVKDRPSSAADGILNVADIPDDDQAELAKRIMLKTGSDMKLEGLSAPLPEGQRGDSSSDGAEVRDAAPQDPDAAVPPVSD